MEDLIPGTATNDEGMNQLRSTRDVLRDKHPLGKPPVESSLLNNPPEQVNPILVANLNAEAIRQAALRTHGAAGLSGLDAHGWRRIAPPLDLPPTICALH